MIRSFATLLAVAILTISASAEVVSRLGHEPADAFAIRSAPEGAELAHDVLEVNDWNFASPALVAFYTHLYPPPNNDPAQFGRLITGYLFAPISPGKYEKIEIDTFEPEGRDAQIDSVFFARIPGSKERKMFILVSWHPNPGDLYQTFVYNHPQGTAKVSRDYELGMRVDGGCQYCRKVRTTASEVKRKIKTFHARHP